MVLEKTPQSPLDSEEMKPVVLMEISPEYSLEGLMLKLKLQYIGRIDAEAEAPGHLMGRTDSVEKTWTLGKIEGWRRSGQQRIRWLDGITN